MLCRGELSHEAVANREGCVGRLVLSILEQNLNLDREMVWEYLEALPIGYVEESKNSFLLVFPSQRQPVHVDKKKSLLLDLEFVLDPLVSMGLAKAWGWRLNACLAKSIIYDETKGMSSFDKNYLPLPPTLKPHSQLWSQLLEGGIFSVGS